MTISTQTHYLMNNLMGIFFGAILPSFLLSGSNNEASAIYFLITLIALIPSNIAYRKGRSFAKWFIYSDTLWIIAMIHSLKIKPNDRGKARSGFHKCPYCGEYSRPEATVCHRCGRDLFIQ
ncbi:hypothetical protein [Megasphaera sp.]|uniref:hypothetical protein n=1 Tax=Megasphaera sp. TaxID=2023260 RepID=UPI003AF00460